MKRRAFLLMTPAFAASCAAETVWAPETEVQRAQYRHAGPASLTLFTVISNHNGSGGHSSLLVNASQRVIFDPAGTFQHPALPERNDVVFGMTDKAVAFYKDYHARETWHVVSQDLAVTPDVAELALQRVKEYGAVPKAMCAISTTTILSSLPGFEAIPRTWYPLAAMRAFGKFPGVTRDTFYDDSPATNDTIEAPAVL